MLLPFTEKPWIIVVSSKKFMQMEPVFLWIWDLEQPAQSGSVKLWINGLTFRSVLTVRVLTTEK